MFVEGASIHACRRSGHYIVAFEKDYAILALLHDTTPSIVVGGFGSQNIVAKVDNRLVRKVAQTLVRNFDGWAILS